MESGCWRGVVVGVVGGFFDDQGEWERWQRNGGRGMMMIMMNLDGWFYTLCY